MTQSNPLPDLCRPIIGIENRTPLEVFDIMCDRFRGHLSSQSAEVARLKEALTRIAELRLATDRGSLRVRADEMWETARAALNQTEEQS